MPWGPLTIVLSRGAGWRSVGSALIRSWPPASRWSHCGLVIDGHVIEALAFAGVTRTPWAAFVARASAWQTVALACPRPQDGERWAMQTLGAGYDWLSVLSVPLRQRWDDGSRWECSGHVLEACRRAGNPVHKVPGGRRTLTPGHVESLLYAADGRLMEMGG